MVIDHYHKVLYFTRGREAQRFSPILVGTLSVNHKDRKIGMKLSKESLIVKVVDPSKEGWNNIVNDLTNWAGITNAIFMQEKQLGMEE